MNQESLNEVAEDMLEVAAYIFKACKEKLVARAENKKLIGVFKNAELVLTEYLNALGLDISVPEVNLTILNRKEALAGMLIKPAAPAADFEKNLLDGYLITCKMVCHAAELMKGYGFVEEITDDQFFEVYDHLKAGDFPIVADRALEVYEVLSALLHTLEDLLSADLHPSSIEKTLAAKSLDDLNLELQREAGRVCRQLRNATCTTIKDEQLERYIQAHERDAIRMLDQAYGFMTTGDAETGLSEPCRKAYVMLKDALKVILNYIEQQLDRYFNLNQLVPNSFRIASAKQILDNKNVLHAKLKSKEIDPLLLRLILNYIDEHCAKESCSYMEQKYAKLLVDILLDVLKSNEQLDWNRKIIVKLIYLNFNKSAFFVWCRRYIAADVDGVANISEQGSQFNWYLKEIKSLTIKPNVAYKASRPPLPDLLNNYILAEVAHLAEWNMQHPGRAVTTFKERAEQFDFKLPLSLTVPQLACIAQLSIDVGVFTIVKGQIMTVMRFLADHVRTRGTDAISVDRLYKQRNAEAKVKDEVERILNAMLDRLRGGELGS